MNLSNLSGRIAKTLSDHSPALLSGVAAAGVLMTAYLASRATFQAAELINEHNQKDDIQDLWMDPKEKIRRYWKLYIPAAGTAVVTVSAIIGSQRIGARRAAGLATALTISERAFENYREKIIDKLGPQKEQKARDEIAQEETNRISAGTRELIVTEGAEVLCCEGYSGRLFKSTIETIKQAQNNFNYRVLNDGYASLTEFYHFIGLSKTSHSDEVGWNSDKLLELEFTTTMIDDKPCVYFTFHLSPRRHYDRSY